MRHQVGSGTSGVVQAAIGEPDVVGCMLAITARLSFNVNVHIPQLCMCIGSAVQLKAFAHLAPFFTPCASLCNAAGPALTALTSDSPGQLPPSPLTLSMRPSPSEPRPARNRLSEPYPHTSALSGAAGCPPSPRAPPVPQLQPKQPTHPPPTRMNTPTLEGFSPMQPMQAELHTVEGAHLIDLAAGQQQGARPGSGLSGSSTSSHRVTARTQEMDMMDSQSSQQPQVGC